MLGIPLTSEEWKQFLSQQATLERLSAVSERLVGVKGFLTQRFSYEGDGVLTVWGTDPDGLARDIDPDLAGSVRVRESAFSRADLARFAETAVEMVGEESIVRIGLDDTDSIRVELNQTSPAGRSVEQVEAVVEQLERFAPAGIPVTAVASSPGADHMEENCQQEGSSVCHPTGGSLRVQVARHSGGTGSCTSGPAVTRGSPWRGVLTAGHCVLLNETGTTDADVTAVGEASASDWASTAFRQNSTGNDQVYVNALKSREIVGTQYISPDSHQLLVAGVRNPVVGELICNSGLVSMREGRPMSERCGLVTDLGAVGGGTGFIEATYESCDGDSGGSIYSVRVPNASSDQVDVWIVGLHHGADLEGCTFTGSRFAQLSQALTRTGTAMINDRNPAGAFRRSLVDAYSTVLQRSTGPDNAGFDYWIGIAGGNCAALVNTMIHSFSISGEYTQQLSSRASIWNSDTRINNRITDMYRAAHHRNPSSGDLTYWRGQVKGGTPEPNPNDEEARREALWVHVGYAIAVASSETNTRIFTADVNSGQPGKCGYDLNAASWN